MALGWEKTLCAPGAVSAPRLDGSHLGLADYDVVRLDPSSHGPPGPASTLLASPEALPS